jgi:hypothetical protein
MMTNIVVIAGTVAIEATKRKAGDRYWVRFSTSNALCVARLV